MIISSRHPDIGFSIIIPARNEARYLPHALKALPPGLHEVIELDGHFTNGTTEVALRVRPDVKISQQTYRGKGTRFDQGTILADQTVTEINPVKDST
jgi:hypothetical protein